jgi:hypothetical protein
VPLSPVRVAICVSRLDMVVVAGLEEDAMMPDAQCPMPAR